MNALQQLLDPCAGNDKAWLILRERGSRWPVWLTERLRGASLVVVVTAEPDESHGALRERVHARAMETGLPDHDVTGVLLCRADGLLPKRKSLAAVLAEQVAQARGGDLTSTLPPN